MMCSNSGLQRLEDSDIVTKARDSAATDDGLSGGMVPSLFIRAAWLIMADGVAEAFPGRGR